MGWDGYGVRYRALYDAYNNTKNDGLILALFSKATLSLDEDSNDDNVDTIVINMHGLVQSITFQLINSILFFCGLFENCETQPPASIG